MLAIALVLVAVLWRVLLLSPWNFSPVLAVLLFFGWRMERKWLWAPVLALAASDLYLNYHYGYKFTADLYFSWLWYAAAVWGGGWLRTRQSVARVAGLALAGSISFFLISNFAVWLVWQMYPKTFAGLLQCYAYGIPFYRNQFSGDLIFTALVFGAPALVRLLHRDAPSELAA